MSTKTRLEKILEEMGFKPLENKAIVVKYAPQEHLSALVSNFFNMEFYVLQICEKEIVLIPYSEFLLVAKQELKKEVSLEIPKDSIRKIEIEVKGFNYKITIETEDSTIRLTTQQKELSDWRSAGVLSADWIGKGFHKENLDGTLEALRNIV